MNLIEDALSVIDKYQKIRLVEEAARNAARGIRNWQTSTRSEKVDVLAQTGFAVLQATDLGNKLGVTPACLANHPVALNLATGVADCARSVTEKRASGKNWKEEDSWKLASKVTSRASNTLNLAANTTKNYSEHFRTASRVMTVTNKAITYTTDDKKPNPPQRNNLQPLSFSFGTYTPGPIDHGFEEMRQPTEQDANLVDEMARLIVAEATIDGAVEQADEICAFVKNAFKQKFPSILPASVKHGWAKWTPKALKEMRLCQEAFKTIWDSINQDENLPDTRDDPLVPKFNWQDLEKNQKFRDFVLTHRFLDLNTPIKQYKDRTFHDEIYNPTVKFGSQPIVEPFEDTSQKKEPLSTKAKNNVPKPTNTFTFRPPRLPKDLNVFFPKVKAKETSKPAMIDSLSDDDDIEVSSKDIEAFKKNPLKGPIPVFIPTYSVQLGKNKLKFPCMPSLHDSMDTQTKKLIDDANLLRQWFDNPQNTQPPFDIQDIKNKILEFWAKNI